MQHFRPAVAVVPTRQVPGSGAVSLSRASFPWFYLLGTVCSHVVLPTWSSQIAARDLQRVDGHRRKTETPGHRQGAQQEHPGLYQRASARPTVYDSVLANAE